eukprot:TRINITY_DN30202_c1_g1_i2.p2 TRINITY_DN30202_c1_g1~~TRINITY_DN30202_c1_g1_i2.p2  ORF type:complete len:205 (-),score=-5.33 TRINITY_DN30202_c1_g1_i2:1333-1947(-)
MVLTSQLQSQGGLNLKIFSKIRGQKSLKQTGQSLKLQRYNQKTCVLYCGTNSTVSIEQNLNHQILTYIQQQYSIQHVQEIQTVHKKIQRKNNSNNHTNYTLKKQVIISKQSKNTAGVKIQNLSFIVQPAILACFVQIKTFATTINFLQRNIQFLKIQNTSPNSSYSSNDVTGFKFCLQSFFQVKSANSIQQNLFDIANQTGFIH